MYDPVRYYAAIKALTDLFGDVNREYVKKVARQIRQIGELSQSSVNRLVQMREMGASVLEVKRMLADAVGVGIADLTPLFATALADARTDPRFAEYASGDTTIPPDTNRRLLRLSDAIMRQTADTLWNFSNTTVIDSSYKEAVDRAVAAVSSGVGDYKAATRDILRKLGSNGVSVTYESGHHRRIDTAVRQNVTNAVKQLSQQASAAIGEDLGYDAVEISAHLRSAPDHEPVQGRVFLNEEFQKMQNGLPFVGVDGRKYEGFRRPIGEWNCAHVPAPFNTATSIRVCNDTQLDEYARKNKEGCQIGNRHYTTYEASQLMRRIETDIRRQKDIAVAAEAAGDDDLRQECQQKINTLSGQYAAVAKTAGIREDRGRMVVQGFRGVKIKPKTLQNAAGHDIIPVKKTLLKAEPNSITQFINKNGGVDRNYYGADGWQTKQISNNDHGHKAESVFGNHGEHAHDYIYDKDGNVHRIPRELTDAERKENQDIL